MSGDGDPSIQGFTTSFSVQPGETVHFKIATDAMAYTIDIYRIGYYGGAGARHITTLSPTATLPQTQPPCLTDDTTGLVDCGNWAESGSWDVPAAAVSGVYIAKLTRSDTNGASQIPFVVRNDASHSDLLFQTSDTTWQAYNTYGGNSLYTGGPGTDPGRAYKVSYNRPFTTRGSGPEDAFFNAEYPMVRWLEENGYDVSYIGGVDVDAAPASLLEQHRVFMSVGHDEYWSGNQRANVEAARDAGVNLAFFSGNQIFWKTRWEPSIDGTSTARRTLVSYKETHAQTKIDPDPAWTGTWRDPLGAAYDAGRPENALAGTIFMVNCCTSAIDVPSSDQQLRIWRNTRLSSLEGVDATLSDGTLGYEWNEDLDNGSRPPGQIDLSSTTLSEPEVLQDQGSTYAPGTATHSITMHRAASGALVFDAGTVQWSWGLDGTHDRGTSTPDEAIQQATVNVFADMSVQPATLQSGLVATTASTDTSPPTAAISTPGDGDTVTAGGQVTVTGTATDTGGGRVAGVEVSTDGGATWHPASGHESWSYTFTPQTTGTVTISARATDDSVNTGPPSSNVTVTVAPHGCPCSIWDNSATPASVGNNDGLPIDYGVKFRTDVDGSISGFRYYKSPGDTGTHTGHLWDTAGDLLASMTFTNETASGWQEVDLSSPVQVTAGTTYIGSIFSSAGVYPDSQAYFAGHGVDNPPLHALADGVDGSNAVFHEGADAFPDQSFNASNYWADVVFSNGPDTTPPFVSARSPISAATNVPVTQAVTATFDEAMDPATISTSTFTLLDPSNTSVAASVEYNAATRTATLTPSSALVPSTTYTARVSGGPSGVTDLAGNAMTADSTWSFTTAAPPADDGPGGPILVIGTSGNPFGRYYGEILHAEGLNEYRGTDITNVTPAILSSYQVVILGDMTLTADQVTMFTNWVTGGGKLIAMHPDSQLAGLLGLTSVGGSVSNAYLKVDTSQPPGQGITDQTIQYHGSADQYQLSGASSVATLYSDASTASSYPAVTQRAVGTNGGQASAFTYDLARSVVYTRQGNPAWAGQERDGQPPIRSDDLFFGASASDPQPDWVNLDKVAIPQADEQQRLLANLVLQMESSNMPIPRFWYLPRGDKAVVVMTGDDHANGGTAGRFDEQIGQSAPGCNVANWECVRSTSYVYPGTPLTDAQAASYTNQGFEVGLHVTTDCADWTPQSLANTYSDQLASWHADYPSLSGPESSRTHCIVESDYSTQPHVELANGIRLDTNYYYWPPTWIQDRPGLFTGSGMPMRFADPDGSAIDVYQATTQMTDESGQSYPATIDTLLDNALGPLGYYGVFTANMHTDNAISSGADAIVASAQARNVPVVSARQMLDWLDGRNASSFGTPTWNNHALTFTVTAGATANGLQTMLPMSSADGAVLTSITQGSTNVGFTTQTIKGVSYAVFDSPSGTYTATYTPDTTPPVISSVAATATPSGDATFTWTTNELSNSSIAYGTNPNSLSSNRSDPTMVTSHSITVHGLVPGTTYSYRVTSTDRAGNGSTSPPTPSAPASILIPTFVTTDTTVGDFSAGTAGACVVVAHSGDGEVELGSTVGAEFSGTQVPSGWDVTPWDTGGTVTVGGGVAGVNGARLGTTATYGAGRSLEFVATFAAESFQHIGFGVDYNAAPWAMFSTGADGTTLKARTNDGSSSTDTVLGSGLLGSPHLFRIDWSNSQVVYWVDGVQVATHAAAISTAMRPLASDLHPDANQISLDWLQMSPYVSTCSFTSRPIDGTTHQGWINLDPVMTTPAGTSIQFNTRTSNDASTWSAWSPVTGNQINSPAARYLQYQAILTTIDGTLTPSLALVRLASNGAPVAPTGVVGVPGNGSAVVSWTAPANNGSGITAYVVTPYIGFIIQPPRTFNSAATSQTIAGLTNGTTYVFKVTAKNANGTGPPSVASASVSVGAPVAPTGVGGVPGNGSAVVSWTAPANNGSGITAYVVTPYVGSVAQPARTFNSTATSQTITGLTNGTTYTFKVTAKNVRGTGPPSVPSGAVTVGAPMAPTGVGGVPGNGSAVVSWTAPGNNGSGITGYVVTPYVGSVAQPARTFNSTATSQTVTGLTNGTTYTFTVAATNANGTGPQSVASAAVTVGAPLAPTGVGGVPGNGSAVVSWTAPANNGSSITGYVVTPYVGSVAQTARTFNSTATSQTVTGLTNGTTYTFTVAAKNVNGTGPPSVASGPVSVGAPAAPTGVGGAPGNGSAVVSWTAPANNGSAITSYVVTPFVGSVAQTAQTFNSTATSQTVTGLTNGTTYTFTVAATNANGTGPQSVASAGVTVGAPAAPTNVTAVPGNGKATVSWTAPANNGSSITGYVVTPYIGTTAQSARAFSATATSQTITGLTNGTTYTFTVAAKNANGTGPQSAASAPVTVGAPSAPSGAAAVPENGSAAVSWTAPANNGSSITSYVVTPFVGSVAQTAQTFNSTATTQTVTGLTNGTTYTFKVAATNARGKGPQSAASPPTSSSNRVGVSKSSIDFGTVSVGQPVSTPLTLTNLGGAGDPAITINALSVNGADSSQFSAAVPRVDPSGTVVTGPPVTLPPGASVIVTVWYAAATGTRSAALTVGSTAANSSLTVPMSGSSPGSAVGFGKSTLTGTASGVNADVVRFGPDGRLYVAEFTGTIHAYTIARTSANNYSVTATETINLIRQIPNHNDDGTVNSSVTTRIITGMLVVGTPSAPQLYVTSSDPRVGGGASGTQTNLDTNSSMVSRLDRNGATWTRTDLVRGLPRSQENHSANGLALDPATNTLYVAQGGNTNMGAPSHNFNFLPEYAYSAAILKVDLTAIGNTTYDLPTLADDHLPNLTGPFGGDFGRRQAKIVPGGPVQVYAPGFRNPYDVVITRAGKMYTVDNGANAGWGDIPAGNGPGGTCTNATQEPGVSDPDALHLITGAGYYGGHPNPTRGNRANTFDTPAQSPVTAANPVECNYLKPGTSASPALTTFNGSTNGIAEYTASNFDGVLNGNLLFANYNGNVFDVKLDSTGAVVSNQTLLSNVSTHPLSLATQGDTGAFPGVIFVGDNATGSILVFEPNDFGGATNTCTGLSSSSDDDGDGYTNADEIANHTNPCSAGSVPHDWNHNGKSDLIDPDDDAMPGDTTPLPDTSDPFAVDAHNGKTMTIPFVYTWDNGEQPAQCAPTPFPSGCPGGLLNMGFTGLMTDRHTDYGNLYDTSNMILGGAAGVLTVAKVPPGDALGAANTQQYGFQLGVNTSGVGVFTVHTRLISPFAGTTPSGNQSFGLQLGTGDQDNYFKLVATANRGSPGIQAVAEVGGVPSFGAVSSVAMPSAAASSIDLYLTVDPATGTVQPSYRLVDAGGVAGPLTQAASPQTIPTSWFAGPNDGLALGIISTSSGGPTYSATWKGMDTFLGSPAG